MGVYIRNGETEPQQVSGNPQALPNLQSSVHHPLPHREGIGAIVPLFPSTQ